MCLLLHAGPPARPLTCSFAAAGVETWPDGRKYHGAWKCDAFDGDGVFSWADSTVFKGTLRRYCPIEGELFHPSGEVFVVLCAMPRLTPRLKQPESLQLLKFPCCLVWFGLVWFALFGGRSR
jgi:hypothetical protein